MSHTARVSISEGKRFGRSVFCAMTKLGQLLHMLVYKSRGKSQDHHEAIVDPYPTDERESKKEFRPLPRSGFVSAHQDP